MILYRSVGLQELALVYDSGMKAFPARLSQQPIFYPVLQLEYARQVALDWNVKNGQYAGYVTQFKVDDDYISRFEEHTVGESRFEEFWIPAEDLDEFNQHITGHIKVLEAYFGEAFQGFTPDEYGLQAKNAVEQFTLLANSFVYKRMDFYLEIKRNHKAVFLNYPFWLTQDFKNPGLREKVLQAIKEAWLTSFPKTPLPVPPPVREDIPLVNQIETQTLIDPVQEESEPEEEQSDSYPRMDPVHEEAPRVEQAAPHYLARPRYQGLPPVEPTHARSQGLPAQKEAAPVEQAESHVRQGVELGLSGRYREAVEALSRAVAKDPGHAAAYTSLGVAFHRLDEDERALASYEAALRMDPGDADAHYFRANILYHTGNTREAIAGYTLAIGLDPELIEAHQRPNPQDRLTDYIEAPAGMYRIARPAQRILQLNKLIDASPRQAELFKERAAHYYRLWNYEQAIADYSSSLAIQPEDAEALHFRGMAYEQMGDTDRALEDYRRANAIDPQLSSIYINRGIEFGRLGNFRQSVTSLTEGIRLAPANPDIYFNRGTSYYQLGELERAIDDFSRVIQLSPKDEDAYYWRGISQEEAGRRQDAIADYRQFLSISQNSQTREEIRQKLRRWNVGEQDVTSERRDAPVDRQKTNQALSGKPGRTLDLHDLITALGERAQKSIWLGSELECYGEAAGELISLTRQNLPIEGRDLTRLTSKIRQTTRGDFQAFDPAGATHWIFIRAWDGSGFYIETNDAKSSERLKSHFQSIEEVEGATPPYEGLFIRKL